MQSVRDFVRPGAIAGFASSLVLLAGVCAGQEAPADELVDDQPAPEAPPTARERALEERVASLEARLAAQEEPPARSGGEAEPEQEGALVGALRAALERVEVHGFVNALFGYGIARPSGAHKEAFPLRVNDDDHDTFTVPSAKLGLARPVEGRGWDVGFGLQVAAGRMVEDVFSVDPEFLGGEEINLAQGWFDLQVPTSHAPVLVRVGRTYGFFGVESLDLPDNPNLSLSYFANFTPYTHTGVSVGTELVGGLAYTQWVVNGWDLVVDSNDAKSYGGQLSWSGGEGQPWVAFNWLVGAEQPDDVSHLRWLCELDLVWAVRPTTELRAALHYGQEEAAAIGGGVAKYGGAQVIVRQDLATSSGGDVTLYLAGRLGYWRDQGGSKTGADQALLDTTVTLGLAVLDHGLVRLEYRRDTSTSDDVFLGRRGQLTADHQDTLAIDVSFTF